MLPAEYQDSFQIDGRTVNVDYKVGFGFLEYNARIQDSGNEFSGYFTCIGGWNNTMLIKSLRDNLVYHRFIS